MVVVAFAGVLALIGAVLLWLTSRRPTTTAGSGISRGAFVRGAPFVLAAGALGAGGTIRFLWPRVTDVFGSRFDVGSPAEIRQTIERDGVVYNTDGRFYIVAYNTDDPDNPYVRAGVAVDSLMAIYQRCPHLGCRVPYCPDSGWFECPCHAAYFNEAGELMGGPAPHGMWRFRTELDEFGRLVVDTAEPIAQPERGYVSVDSLGRKQPVCIEP